MTDWLFDIWHDLPGLYLDVAQLGSVYLFLVCAAVFLPLSFVMRSSTRQPVLHAGMVPDVVYWLVAPWLIYVPLTVWLFARLTDAGFYAFDDAGQLVDGLLPVRLLPVLVQALLILIIMDVVQYWIHRASHAPALWKFHAIHHSATHVDWLTSTRFHPLDAIVRSYCVYLLVAALGFDTEAWLMLVPFNTLYSPLVHANLDWDYGPFRYLLVSPLFHRWHHTYADEGGRANFAPTFPFIDVLFGTYYAPADVRPRVFGAQHDAISQVNILSQLAYPFR